MEKTRFQYLYKNKTNVFINTCTCIKEYTSRLKLFIFNLHIYFIFGIIILVRIFQVEECTWAPRSRLEVEFTPCLS